MIAFKFYDKPESASPEEFALWQCGYRRASVNMLLVCLQMLVLGIVIGAR